MLAKTVLAAIVIAPLACVAQENQCGPNGAAILKSAYSSLVTHSPATYRVESGKVRIAPDSAVGDDPLAMVCRYWPVHPQYLLAAVPIIRDTQDDSGARGDLDVLVLDSDTFELRSRLKIANFISDDAIYLTQIFFDTAPYRLSPGRIAFGIRTSVESHSRVDSYYQTTLRLYELDGAELKPILDSIEVEQINGKQVAGECAGEFQSVRRTLIMAPKRHHGAADIIVKTDSYQALDVERNGECQASDVKQTTSTAQLTFDGQHYIVPEALKGAR